MRLINRLFLFALLSATLAVNILAQTNPPLYAVQSGSGFINGAGDERWGLSLNLSYGSHVTQIANQGYNHAGLQEYGFRFNAAGVPTIVNGGGNYNEFSYTFSLIIEGQQRTRCSYGLSLRGTRAIYLGYNAQGNGEIAVPITLSGNLLCDPEFTPSILPGYQANLSGRGLAIVKYGFMGPEYPLTTRFQSVTYTFLPPDANPIDVAQFFVRDHYESFLARSPDPNGLNYWTNEITRCGTNATCINQRRIDVSAAFFIEQEFANTGLFYYLTDRATLGGQPTYQRYVRERYNLQSGQPDSRTAFLVNWVGLPEFIVKYPLTQTPTQFVAALLQNVRVTTGVDLSAQSNNLLAAYLATGEQTSGRAAVVRLLTENAALRQAEYNRAFVLMQYFGYLQRETDTDGYAFWLAQLNQNPANYRGMVCAFITSSEYQQRFSPNITRNNTTCQ